ncbi:MAG: PepSY domain-containing protein [Chryseobacterium sp.]|nr:MAG: PepSY domain-containing protein [Chryseobacterium sp.]
MPQQEQKALKNKKSRKSPFKRVTDWLHLWLGIASGAIVFIVAITGCIFTFQVEITNWLDKDKLYVEAPADAKILPLTSIQKNVQQALLPGRQIEAITIYQDPNRAWECLTYKEGDPNAFSYFNTVEYSELLLINPYTGKIISLEDYKYNFFNIVKAIHWSLLLGDKYGKPIVGYSTLVFVVLLITGMILWWPSKWTNSSVEKSFKIKWKAKFKRVNYDLHNVAGFYALIITLILSLTGLVWAFEWFQKGVYMTAAQTTVPLEYKSMISDTTYVIGLSKPLDIAFMETKTIMPNAVRYSISPAQGKTGVIYATAYYGKEIYYDFDGLQFDQYSGKLLYRKDHHEKNAGEKLIGMNYDIHVGAILGLPGKILVFLGSLVAASLPITGFLVWLGKKKKSKKRG